jgi:hypothetical protein
LAVPLWLRLRVRLQTDFSKIKSYQPSHFLTFLHVTHIYSRFNHAKEIIGTKILMFTPVMFILKKNRHKIYGSAQISPLDWKISVFLQIPVLRLRFADEKSSKY